jgi:type IV secretion system protein VirB10
MADQNNGGEQTGDLLRPLRSRPTGTKAIAWYGIVGLLATVAIVYLVGIFSAPKREAAGATSLLSQAAPQARSNPDDVFRYSGKVVEDHRTAAKRIVPRPERSAAPLRDASALATPATPAPPLIVVPHDNAAATVLGATTRDVPDVSEAAASRVRVLLPTPAPDDGLGSRAPREATSQPRSVRRGIVVVYGAPNTALTPVPAAAAGPLATSIPASGLAGPTGAVSSPASAPSLRSGTGAGAGIAALRGETMPGYRRAPLARYLVAAGTVIPVQLDVALESDVAGPVVAHVIRDVLDQLSGKTLIPGGTRAIGDYTGLTAGQSRLSMVWRRLVFPDRSSFALDNVPALDEQGRVGVGGRLNTHEGALVRRSLFAGVLAEITRRLAGQTSGNTVVVVNPGPGSPTGLPQAALDLANQLNERDARVPAGVTIPQNAIFSLYVDRDMLFDAPYAPMTPGSASSS